MVREVGWESRSEERRAETGTLSKKLNPKQLDTKPLTVLEVWGHTPAEVTGGMAGALQTGDSGQ